jgi:phosphate transport system substrate-binding protein
MIKSLQLAIALLAFNAAGIAAERDQIRIVGSPSLLPATETVTRHFTANWPYPAPTLEITGTGVGFGRFCDGVGHEYADINAASRRITEAEFSVCNKNGVSDITEIEFARDALVLVSAKASPPLDLAVADLHSALSKEVEKHGELVPNETKHWQDVDSSLPRSEIRFIGPSSRSTLMFVFLEQIMAAGCPDSSTFRSLGKEQRYKSCRSVRGADAYQEGPKNPAHILDLLREQLTAVAVVRYSYFAQHLDSLTAHRMNGVAPTADTIGTGRYPFVTPLYLYVKNRHAHSIPGLQQLLYEFTSERAISPDGYLTMTGVVPLDDIGRNRARDNAFSMQPLSLQIEQ